MLDSLTSEKNVHADLAAERKVMEKWRVNLAREIHMVILNVSGGGQRSALWTLKVLQEADSATEGRVYKILHLITGSSGGILGAAFYRESADTDMIRVLPDRHPHEQGLCKPIWALIY
ncbi:MAG: hypothetical protein U5L96_20750 [Owenweeksia sp.]|nr:hypothetical protein [Owenweeksia sp.]